MSDLYELSRPIPAKFIKPAPQGKYGNYVPHTVIRQAILLSVGPYSWHVVPELILRGPVPPVLDRATGEVKHAALENAIHGGVFRLTVTIDGQKVEVEEVGSCDAGAYEWNDAERLKKAASDAVKRAAMAEGLGLHMWCSTEEEYFLARKLRERMDAEPHPEEESAVVGGVADDEPSALVQPVDVDTPEAAQFQVNKVLKELYGDDKDTKADALIMAAAAVASDVPSLHWNTLTAEQADLLIAELRSAAGDDGSPPPEPLPGGAPPPADPTTGASPDTGVGPEGKEVAAVGGSSGLGEDPGTPDLAGLREWAEAAPLDAPHAEQYAWLRTLATGMFKAGFVRWQLVRLPKMLGYTPAKGKAQESVGLPDRRSLGRVVKDAAEEALVDLAAEEAP